MTTPHPFDSAMRLRREGEHTYSACTSEAYRNYVGPFGGTTVALALRAMLLHPLRAGFPVSMTINFAAPIGEGVFCVQVMPVRTSRSTQHWTIRMEQAGRVVVLGTALFGSRRRAWSAPERVPPRVPPAESVARADGTGREPCVERYEMRFVEGEFPSAWHGEDTGSSQSILWLRDDPPRPLDLCSLAAIADAFFPRVWRRRPRQTPVGTVTMMLNFHADLASLRRVADRHLLGQVRAYGFREGFCDQTGHLWSDTGELLITVHQVAWYRD